MNGFSYVIIDIELRRAEIRRFRDVSLGQKIAEDVHMGLLQCDVLYYFDLV